MNFRSKKLGDFLVFLEKYSKLTAMFQIKVIDSMKIHIFYLTIFFISPIVFLIIDFIAPGITGAMGRIEAL